MGIHRLNPMDMGLTVGTARRAAKVSTQRTVAESLLHNAPRNRMVSSLRRCGSSAAGQMYLLSENSHEMRVKLDVDGDSYFDVSLTSFLCEMWTVFESTDETHIEFNDNTSLNWLKLNLWKVKFLESATGSA